MNHFEENKPGKAREKYQNPGEGEEKTHQLDHGSQEDKKN